jgi:transposase InsO family protein
VLVRFALERILYRMTQSLHADRFLLKGALLFTLWYDMPHRATRIVDLLGIGASDLNAVALAQAFQDTAAVSVDDGIVFDPASVTVEEIRKEAGYGGVRLIVAGDLARARCKTQIDVGFGDAVTPAPVDAVYPVLLDDFPAARLRVHPRDWNSTTIEVFIRAVHEYILWYNEKRIKMLLGSLSPIEYRESLGSIN